MKKWKIGLLGAVAMSAIMLVPVFLSGAAPGAGAAGSAGADADAPPARSEPLPAADPDYIAFQVGNRYGVKEHARFPLGSNIKPFVDSSGRVQVPLQAAGEGIGLDVTWDEVNQIATLINGKTTATLTVGIPQMTVGRSIISSPTVI